MLRQFKVWLTKANKPNKNEVIDLENVRSLTCRQERFVNAYTSNLALFNASEASRIAGYSEANCRVAGHRNLKKAHIRSAITNRLQVSFEANEITVEKVLGDLEFARVLSIQAGKYHSAIRASELQGRYLQMFSDRFERFSTQSIDSVSSEELWELVIDLMQQPEMARMLRQAFIGQQGGGSET